MANTSGVPLAREEVSDDSYLPERIKKFKDRLASAVYRLDLERVRYYTQAYKLTENEPSYIRAAMGLEKTLTSMTIRIEDEELIVGSKSAVAWGDPIYIEASVNHPHIKLALDMYGSGKSVEEALEGMGGGGLGVENAAFLRELPNISEEEYSELAKEIIPYWKNKTVEARRIALWEKEGVITDRKAIASYGNPVGWIVTDHPPQGHLTVGIKKVLDMGFAGIALQAEQKLEGLKGQAESAKAAKDFWESVLVSAQAVCSFASRYAALAGEMAQKANGQRKNDLLEIKERCLRVPMEPPRNFMEALQSIWITQVVALISYGGSSIIAPGRLDQFLYPFYRKDLDTGRITREQALEALMEYYIKLATNIYFGPNNVTIGGIDRDGEDAVNDVSYLFLDVHLRLKGCMRNGLAVRISPKTPPDFLRRACYTYRYAGGVALYNDDVVIRDLLFDGYSLEDARNYSIVGCVEPTGTGNNNGYTATNGISLMALFEAALNEGGRYVSGWKPIGPATPPASSFETFHDVKEAFIKQLSSAVDECVRAADLKDRVIADYYPLPLLSSTIEGCVESGKDITGGGARYNHGCITNGSLATVANSMAAVRQVVFDQKLLSMEELVRRLRNNFQDAENLRRQMLVIPKYGNDDEYVDELAVWITSAYNQEVRKHKFWMGGVYRPCIISVATHIAWGASLGASPDGRVAGAPIANGISPANGDERNGLTALFASAAKVCSIPMSDGTALNVILNPLTVRTDEGLSKFVSLIETYFALGGRQVQFNPMSRETLLDAQKNPERYPDLNVKVSGFSFRFIDLTIKVQNDIIARTEFCVT
ncbi:MAG: Choline trimethylamine-lyase [Syntrophomonadaceae bacterium]|nr:Choline trimethylamine-lyase [Bacillota bacterium]